MQNIWTRTRSFCFMHREIGNFNLTKLKIFGVGMNHLQHINCLIRCPKTNTMIVTNSDLMSNSTITNHVPPPSRFLLRLSINLILHCALGKKNSSPVLFTRSVTWCLNNKHRLSYSSVLLSSSLSIACWYFSSPSCALDKKDFLSSWFTSDEILKDRCNGPQSVQG